MRIDLQGLGFEGGGGGEFNDVKDDFGLILILGDFWKISQGGYVNFRI